MFHVLVHSPNDQSSARLKPEVKNSLLASWPKHFGTSATHFPGALTESWIGSRAAGPQTSTYVRHYHCGWQLNWAHYNRNLLIARELSERLLLKSRCWFCTHFWRPKVHD